MSGKFHVSTHCVSGGPPGPGRTNWRTQSRASTSYFYSRQECEGVHLCNPTLTLNRMRRIVGGGVKGGGRLRRRPESGSSSRYALFRVSLKPTFISCCLFKLHLVSTWRRVASIKPSILLFFFQNWTGTWWNALSLILNGAILGLAGAGANKQMSFAHSSSFFSLLLPLLYVRWIPENSIAIDLITIYWRTQSNALFYV